jgi:hypothetical protein
MNRVLSVFVGAVVLLAVVAGVVVAKRAAPELDSHTPEGVVQQYLQAVIAGDYQVAAGLISPSAGCDVSDVASAYDPGSARIVLDHTAVDGDHAIVTVDVTEGSGEGPFESTGYSHTERISVARGGGVWKITGSPWLLSPCGSTKG